VLGTLNEAQARVFVAQKALEHGRGAVSRLARLVEANTAGDPMSYLLWTNKSTRTLAEERARQGCTVSHVTVARCLGELGYSLQRTSRPSRERNIPIEMHS
jgi:Rhodopirellula transposase DDE domain